VQWQAHLELGLRRVQRVRFAAAGELVAPPPVDIAVTVSR
jgi:hypothetical protein